MPLEFDGVNGIIKNTTSDGDITIKGNDGGSEISALTFDMSAEGAATFNSTVTSTASTTITVADNSDNLTLVSTDGDSNSGPNLRLYRNSSSPADGDILGQIDFEGRNDNSQDVVYARIRAVAEDVSDGTEDARLIMEKVVGGSTTEVMRSIGSETVFNDGSIDLDFRVESNGNTHALFVDGGNNEVSIGNSNPNAFNTQARNLVVGTGSGANGITIYSGNDSSGNIFFADGTSGDDPTRGGVNYNHSSNELSLRINDSPRLTIADGGPTTINTAGNEDTLTLTSTDADAGVGPNLRLYRNSSSPANDDLMGTIEFEGRNDNSQDVVYAQMSIESSDVSDGTEDANWFVKVMSAGTLRNLFQLNASEVVFNQDSQDTNFRVESNGNPHMISVDAGNDKVGIGLADPTGTFHVKTNNAGTTMYIEDSHAGNGDGPELYLYRNSSSPADADDIGIIKFLGKNDAGQDAIYGQIKSIITDASDGTEDGKIEFYHMFGGSLAPSLQLTTAGVVINESSNDIDFRVESNGNTHKFMVNGGNNLVGINADPDLGSALHIKNADSGGSSNNDADELVLENSANTGISILSGTGSSGTISFGDSGAANRGLVTYDHSSDSMKFGCNGAVQARITNGGTISLNESAPDAPSNGLTMNTGSNDGNVLTMKSSDVAHGMTAIAETDTFVEMLKNSDGGGALNLTTLSETATAFRHIACITGSNTAESTAATSAWGVDARKKNGTSVEGLAADDNLASFRHSDEAQVIFKGDGEIFSNQTATVGTYDAYEDAQLIRAYDLSHMKGVIDSKFDKFVQYNKDDLQKARLIGTDDDGNATPFVNITGMSRLHNGAIWQQYEKHQKLASAFYKLAEKTIGKEEADKLLTEEEIQLLN